MSLRFTSANMDFLRGEDRAYLLHLCERSDVLLLQECKNIDVASLLPGGGWKAIQILDNAAKAGCAIAYRVGKVRVLTAHLTVGVTPFIRRKRIKMETRYILHGQIQDTETGELFYAVSAHLPPKRFRVLQPVMVRRLRRVIKGRPRAVIGLDANQDVDALASRMRLRSYARGIVGLMAARGVRQTGEKVIDGWGEQMGFTDHPAVTVRFRSTP